MAKLVHLLSELVGSISTLRIGFDSLDVPLPPSDHYTLLLSLVANSVVKIWEMTDKNYPAPRG